MLLLHSRYSKTEEKGFNSQRTWDFLWKELHGSFSGLVTMHGVRPFMQQPPALEPFTMPKSQGNQVSLQVSPRGKPPIVEMIILVVTTEMK